MKVSDILTGLIFIVAGTCISLQAQRFPAIMGQPYGSAFFPTLIGIGMVLGGLFLFLTAIVKKKVWPLITLPEWLKSSRGIGSLLLILATLGFYMAFSARLGFCMTAFIMLFVIQKWMGAKLLSALVISTAATAVFYTVFAILLRVPLPHGLVERFL